MPGDLDGSGIRQYIRVDRVSYSDGSHPHGLIAFPKGPARLRQRPGQLAGGNTVPGRA